MRKNAYRAWLTVTFTAAEIQRFFTQRSGDLLQDADLELWNADAVAHTYGASPARRKSPIHPDNDAYRGRYSRCRMEPMGGADDQAAYLQHSQPQPVPGSTQMMLRFRYRRGQRATQGARHLLAGHAGKLPLPASIGWSEATGAAAFTTDAGDNVDSWFYVEARGTGALGWTTSGSAHPAASRRRRRWSWRFPTAASSPSWCQMGGGGVSNAEQ